MWHNVLRCSSALQAKKSSYVPVYYRVVCMCIEIAETWLVRTYKATRIV